MGLSMLGRHRTVAALPSMGHVGCTSRSHEGSVLAPLCQGRTARADEAGTPSLEGRAGYCQQSIAGYTCGLGWAATNQARG